MKKIISLILVTIMVASFLVACGGNNNVDVPPPAQNGYTEENDEVDRSLDGTYTHGAETIVLDGTNFTVSGGTGHRHFPNGTGTFEISGGNIYFTYDDGEVAVRRFSSNANSISIDGHRYPRR